MLCTVTPNVKKSAVLAAQISPWMKYYEAVLRLMPSLSPIGISVEWAHLYRNHHALRDYVHRPETSTTLSSFGEPPSKRRFPDLVQSSLSVADYFYDTFSEANDERHRQAILVKGIPHLKDTEETTAQWAATLTNWNNTRFRCHPVLTLFLEHILCQNQPFPTATGTATPMCSAKKLNSSTASIPSTSGRRMRSSPKPTKSITPTSLRAKAPPPTPPQCETGKHAAPSTRIATQSDAPLTPLMTPLHGTSISLRTMNISSTICRDTTHKSPHGQDRKILAPIPTHTRRDDPP
ncbi:hypothetical protein BDK51DRAFT_52078 [Blyttiomyces helicus]|uniref:Uncharacterized protein n=1 Tax=Blyttiomyces helicus TaxID=388810 RepID=A0A4V1ISA7_9FUNG|nr:hypothetical protein BDK51DRAFT_52078 [Blyttiomyces helicus]|eukprot:RKO92897.1 hypothetical protein BDK51DRAFT_52078 [Blyttiomyces helicus]